MIDLIDNSFVHILSNNKLIEEEMSDENTELLPIGAYISTTVPLNSEAASMIGISQRQTSLY